MIVGSPTRRGLRRLLSRRRRATPAPVARPERARWTPPAPGGVWIGQAVVRSVDPAGRPLLLFQDGHGSLLTAEWALPFRYRPAAGDVLRVARHGERAWVLGVVSGQGRAQLLFAAGLTLRARTLRLRSDVAVKLRAQRLRLRAGTLEVLVETLHEKLGDATRQVGRLLLQAGQVRRVIDGEDWTQARTRTVLAQDAVVVDGEQLKVG
jgi:hypothetical protein